jgi:geranylgeranyl diphosphate synthase type II
MKEQYARYKSLVEDYLNHLFPDDSELSSAMRYSLMLGGKRLRPVTTLAFCELGGGTAEDALPFACAIELIHTYSLIHDDLPCIDNDDMRRGKPTNHKVYGEAMALLAGDGLLTYAFRLMLTADLPSRKILKAAKCVETAAFDMVRGQVMDIKQSPDEKLMRELKTGALFMAGAKVGCIIAGANKKMIAAAEEYAGNLGLAFQLRDDILDEEGGSQSNVSKLTDNAKKALKPFNGNTFLCDFADWLCIREF